MAKYPISLTFIESWAAKKEVPYVRAQPDPGFNGRNFDMIDYNVNITDARPMKDRFKLDVNGFEFIEDAQSSTPELLDALRGNDKAAIEKLYYPQVERIVKEMTKATRVFTFDHTVRRRVRAAGERGPDGKEKIAPVLNGQEQPAKLVHCDQSTDGAIRRVHMHMGAEAPELLKKRCQIINIWRPLCGPVEDWPLGMMDVQTLQTSDILPTYLWKNQYEFTGSTMSISHQESQSWYYLDHQRTDELTFIKIWDNSKEVAATLCPHAAFQHPETREGAPLRESVETRCLVFYDDDI